MVGAYFDPVFSFQRGRSAPAAAVTRQGSRCTSRLCLNRHGGIPSPPLSSIEIFGSHNGTRTDHRNSARVFGQRSPGYQSESHRLDRKAAFDRSAKPLSISRIADHGPRRHGFSWILVEDRDSLTSSLTVHYWCFRRCSSQVNLFWVLSFLTAIAKAFLLPTTITSLLPLVIAVYIRFRCSRM